MRVRFICAVILLLLACWLQFWFAGLGVSINVIFATLIVCAFFFDIWELVALILVGMLIINWQPALSLELILFALIPLAAFALHHFFDSQPWIAAPVGIICGLLILYVAIAPEIFLPHFIVFCEDVFGSLVWGVVVYSALARLKNKNA
jgi:hypothetical protein